ncbi:MAG: ATP-binding protein [Bacteroidetes bacterium]|nr:ATP-binding protein [Bacteroidota bacterium]
MEINAGNMSSFDLIMRDNDWALYLNGNPLLTPGGYEIAHPEARLLKHILTRLSLDGHVDTGSVNPYTLFSFQKDFLDLGNDPLALGMQKLADEDILVGIKTGKINVIPGNDNDKTLELLENNSYILNLIYTGVSEINTSINNFLFTGIMPEEKDVAGQSFIHDRISDAYLSMNPMQRSAVCLLLHYHRSGILLPLLFVSGRIIASEYVNLWVATHLKFPEQYAASLPGVTGYEPESHDLVQDAGSAVMMFRRLYEEAIQVKEYLSLFEENGNSFMGVLSLIREGESDTLEFKTSLRWDVYQNKKNPAIEHASLKSIAAFLNSSGGDLLIGVRDDGSISGIEIDVFENDDKFLLHFWNLVKSSLGQESSPYVKTILEKFDGKTVCRVSCNPAPFPVFLQQKGFGEEFYIRVGPASAALEIREALKYIEDRFNRKH